MSKSKLPTLTVLLSLCVSLSCSFQTAADCRQLCSLPFDQKNKTFLSQPLKRQIDLYLECTCKEDSITSDSRFAGYVAKDGKEAVPVLMERLKSEKDENKQLKIIGAFGQMSVEDLHGRQDVVALVKQTVTNMKGGFSAAANGDYRDKKYAEELAMKIQLDSTELDRR